MANPRGQQRDKPFRDALRLAIAKTEDDPRSLRVVANKLIDKAASGDVQAIKELADRLDGKVAQPIAGADGEGPAELLISWKSRSTTPQDNNSSPSTIEQNALPALLPTDELEKP